MILEKLQDLNPEKSPGPDGWYPVLLKNLAYLINTSLAILFQKSLNENLVPFQWLEACITAIHKKGLNNLFENYRPVGITSIIGKLMESIVRDKLVAHMELNNALSEKQHGFVPNKNCRTNLMICMENWTYMLENGHPFIHPFIHLRMGFDVFLFPS